MTSIRCRAAPLTPTDSPAKARIRAVGHSPHRVLEHCRVCDEGPGVAIWPPCLFVFASNLRHAIGKVTRRRLSGNFKVKASNAND